MNIHTLYGFFNRRFRPRRIRQLKALLPELMQAETTVIDVGGTPGWWAEMGVVTRNITIVNIDNVHEAEVRAAGYRFICADACSLPFEDGTFDVALSNSVIEHVGGLAQQQQFAAEMRRCGRAVYMQTPNRWFPVEPHLMALGLHWLPRSVQRRCIRWASVWGLVAKPDQGRIDEFIDSTRLLTAREVTDLYPDCRLLHERVLGLVKSFIAVRPAAAKA